MEYKHFWKHRVVYILIMLHTLFPLSLMHVPSFNGASQHLNKTSNIHRLLKGKLEHKEVKLQPKCSAASYQGIRGRKQWAPILPALMVKPQETSSAVIVTGAEVESLQACKPPADVANSAIYPSIVHSLALKNTHTVLTTWLFLLSWWSI